MEQSVSKRLRLNQLRLVLCVMLVLFVVMLVFTINWLKSYNQKYGFFTKTQAEVIRHTEIDGTTYDVLSYNVNNVEYNKTTEYPSKNDVGDIITIYYDKDNPVGVIYSLDSRRVILPVITSLFGVSSIALIVVYIVGVVDYKRREKLKAYLAYKATLNSTDIDEESSTETQEENAVDENNLTQIEGTEPLKKDKNIVTEKANLDVEKGAEKTTKSDTVIEKHTQNAVKNENRKTQNTVKNENKKAQNDTQKAPIKQTRPKKEINVSSPSTKKETSVKSDMNTNVVAKKDTKNSNGQAQKRSVKAKTNSKKPKSEAPVSQSNVSKKSSKN